MIRGNECFKESNQWTSHDFVVDMINIEILRGWERTVILSGPRQFFF